MARLTVRKDEPAQCFYVKCAGGFTTPEDVRRILKNHRGDYSGETQAWQLPLADAGAVIAAIRVAGHYVDLIDPNAPRPVAVLQECGNPDCRAPYRAGYENRLGLDCKACGRQLVLVHAHACGDQCRQNAVPAKAAG